MSPPLGRIIGNTRQVDEMAACHATRFGYTAHTRHGDRIVESRTPVAGGVAVMRHPLAKGRKAGQVLVKLVSCRDAAARGLGLGKIHDVDGYCAANTKRPAPNPAQVSGRACAAQP